MWVALRVQSVLRGQLSQFTRSIRLDHIVFCALVGLIGAATPEKHLFSLQQQISHRDIHSDPGPDSKAQAPTCETFGWCCNLTLSIKLYTLMKRLKNW